MVEMRDAARHLAKVTVSFQAARHTKVADSA